MVESLWEVFKVIGISILILICVLILIAIIKTAIQEFIIKPKKMKKLKEEINKATDSLIEELKKENEHKKCNNCKKSTKKPIKKTTKKEDK